MRQDLDTEEGSGLFSPKGLTHEQYLIREPAAVSETDCLNLKLSTV